MDITPLTLDVVAPWEPTGTHNLADRLIATARVAGCLVHLEAILVVDRHGSQTAADPDNNDTLDHAYAINGDGPFATATIIVDGTPGEYVIVATSFAD